MNMCHIQNFRADTYLIFVTGAPGHRALELGGRRTISFLTLFSVFLDRNSICCTGMNSEKPILASEVTQDAETG